MMKVIKKGEENDLIFTLWEYTTITSPTYLFTFKHDQQNKEFNFIMEDVSLYPERYNEFVLDEGNDVTFDFTGDYMYEVREQESTTNLDPELSGAVVEIGRAIVIGDGTENNQYESVVEENYIFKE